MSYDLEQPEGMFGLMLAIEGVTDAVTIVHGPTGCKQYVADLSERSFRSRNGKYMVRDLFSFKRRFYFYQSRIPCTYLDGDTFVSGATERLEELYGIIANDRPGIIGIINSPGASLIGEDLTKVASDTPTVRFESPGFSLRLGDGYQDGNIAVIRELAKPKTGKKGGVFVIGMGIWQYRWEDSEEEIRRMLALCGIDDVTFLCAGSTAEEISRIADSELNIVMYEEYGRRTAEFCKGGFGTDYQPDRLWRVRRFGRASRRINPHLGVGAQERTPTQFRRRSADVGRTRRGASQRSRPCPQTYCTDFLA